MSLDTKTKLGVLASKRRVEVVDSDYYQIMDNYYQAERKNDTLKCAAVSKQFVDSFKDVIKPGSKRVVKGKSMCVSGDYPGERNLSAALTWLPGKDGLRVKANVIDGRFTTKGSRENVCSLEVFINPTGMYRDLNQFTVIPGGANGSAKVKVGQDPSDPFGAEKDAKSLGISATWKKTARGYTIDAVIPWKAVRGYKTSWSRLPVKACINSPTPDGDVRISTGMPGDPQLEVYTYSVLTAR